MACIYYICILKKLPTTLPYRSTLHVGKIYQSHGSVTGFVFPHVTNAVAVVFPRAFQVLDSFDAMVRCISQASRLQVNRETPMWDVGDRWGRGRREVGLAPQASSTGGAHISSSTAGRRTLFRLLNRHFQLALWANHRREWVLVDYDSSVKECLNRHQISRRNDQYWFKINLNEGKTAENCGWP